MADDDYAAPWRAWVRKYWPRARGTASDWPQPNPPPYLGDDEGLVEPREEEDA